MARSKTRIATTVFFRKMTTGTTRTAQAAGTVESLTHSQVTASTGGLRVGLTIQNPPRNHTAKPRSSKQRPADQQSLPLKRSRTSQTNVSLDVPICDEPGRLSARICTFTACGDARRPQPVVRFCAGPSELRPSQTRQPKL